MTIDLNAPYKNRVETALNNAHLKTALDRSTRRMSGQRVAAMDAVNGEALRTQVRQMKEYVLRNLPDLLESLEANVTANGGQVHWATDGEQAGQIVSGDRATGQCAEGRQGQVHGDRRDSPQRYAGAGRHERG